MEEQFFLSHLKSRKLFMGLVNTLLVKRSSPEGGSVAEPGVGLWKTAGQGGACSDMADMGLIKWPYVSPLYFTKPEVHWEYATVAGESAHAFVYFTRAARRAWRTAQHADCRLWRNIYLFCPGGGQIPGGGPVPPRLMWCLHVCAGVVKYACGNTLYIDNYSLTPCKQKYLDYLWDSLMGVIRKCITRRENGLFSSVMHKVTSLSPVFWHAGSKHNELVNILV